MIQELLKQYLCLIAASNDIYLPWISENKQGRCFFNSETGIISILLEYTYICFTETVLKDNGSRAAILPSMEQLSSQYYFTIRGAAGRGRLC